MASSIYIKSHSSLQLRDQRAPALVQFLRLSPLRQKRIPHRHPCQVPNSPLPGSFCIYSLPAIPAGGISEFTKPTQPPLLPFGFGFGFQFGQAAGLEKEGTKGASTVRVCLCTALRIPRSSRGHIQVPPQRPCSPLCSPMNIMHFLPLFPQRGPSIHDTPHCCYPPCRPVASAVPTSGTSVPTPLSLKVTPTLPLGLL